MKPLSVGLLGLGTVGSGTLKVLLRNRDEIERRIGRPIVITRIGVRSLDKARAITQNMGVDIPLTQDLSAVTKADDISVVVEVMGGTTTARLAVLDAINAGKHVITANKALLAEHGNEIFAAARQHGVMVAFEAAVAVSIPIIKALREALAGNRIEWVAGIINGTTNFILTQMKQHGSSFTDALKQAQLLGYAEADPTFDIEGIDAGHKATLLSAIAFGIPIQFSRAHIEGITQLQAIDITYAEKLGYRIKLIGIARRSEQGIELRVHPSLIPENCLLANVNGAMNGIMIKSDAAGITAYYGAGAGSEETASAVVADLVDVARLELADPQHHVPHLAFHAESLNPIPVLPIGDIHTRYYLRIPVKDEAGVLAAITKLLADQMISIDAMLQRTSSHQGGNAGTDVIIVTHGAQEARIDSAIAAIQALPAVSAQVVRLRVEDLDQVAMH